MGEKGVETGASTSGTVGVGVTDPMAGTGNSVQDILAQEGARAAAAAGALGISPPAGASTMDAVSTVLPPYPPTS